MDSISRVHMCSLSSSEPGFNGFNPVLESVRIPCKQLYLELVPGAQPYLRWENMADTEDSFDTQADGDNDTGIH